MQYGREKPPNLEDRVSLRDYLFGLGIHVSRNSDRRPRSTAVPSRGDPISGCRTRPLWLDACKRRTLTGRPPMGFGIPPCDLDLRPRLRVVVLGGTACAIRY